MKKMVGEVLIVVACAAMAPAATVEYDPAGSGTWGETTRWKGGATLAAGDTVLINGCTGTVTDADVAYFQLADKITFSGTKPCLAVSNETDFAADVSIAGNGTLLKAGGGEFNISSYKKFGSTSICYVDVVILGGTLSLQGSQPTTGDLTIKNLTVWAPGRFMGTQYAGMSFTGGLYGDGTVDNNTAGQSNRTMCFAGSPDPEHPAVFSGDFVGYAYYCSRSSSVGYQYLTGTNSTATRGMLLYKSKDMDQVVGVSSFGNTAGVKAPWGNTQVQWRGWGNHLLYIGHGETTDRTFYYGNAGKLPMLDAGEYGGLTLKGDWSVNVRECNFMNGADFAGHGTNVFAANFTTTTNLDGRPIAIYVRKFGPGAWRFTAGKKREMRGVFETVEGELQFDSIAEKGVTCAIGDSTVLHQRYCDQIDDSKAVPYAYLLGNGTNDVSAPTLATMNYTGDGDGVVSTRPIAVNGAGRLKSDGASLSWDGITSASAGIHTIVLGGDVPYASAGAITNGPGTLAVAKDGAGTWVIGGDLDVTGGFAANEGSLVIPKSGDYEWYRLTLMGSWRDATNAEGVVIGTLPNNDGGRFALGQWSLLDDDGTNWILDLPHNTAADGNPRMLNPGEAAMGQTNYCWLGHGSGVGYKYVLTNLFSSASAVFAAMNCTYSVKNGTLSTNELSWGTNPAYQTDPERWVRVVARLPAGAKKITRYDLRSSGAWPNEGSSTVRIPRSWMLEGSLDGLRWEVLDTVISNTQDKIVTNVGGTYKWFSNNLTTPGEGLGPVQSGKTLVRPAAVGPVAAAAGATLETVVSIEADGIAYDCAAGGGTIRGFTLGENAKVHLVNLAENQVNTTLPLSFQGAAAYAGRRFAVTVDGVAKSNFSAYLTADGLRVVRKGAMMIFR